VPRRGGDCDAAENCDGVSGACPADAFLPPSTVCRAVSGGEICDQAENCTGGSPTCPADLVLPNGTTCRVSAGDCDVTEDCDGVSKNCPANGFVSSSTTCRRLGRRLRSGRELHWQHRDLPGGCQEHLGMPCIRGVCDLAETATASGTTVRPTRRARRCAVAPAASAMSRKSATASPMRVRPIRRWPAATECRGVAGICDVAESSATA
jgi:hypothetical protein